MRIAKAKAAEQIIVEEQDCTRSHWVVIDELPEKKQAWFYTRNDRRCEATSEAVCQAPTTSLRDEEQLCNDTLTITFAGCILHGWLRLVGAGRRTPELDDAFYHVNSVVAVPGDADRNGVGFSFLLNHFDLDLNPCTPASFAQVMR